MERTLPLEVDTDADDNVSGQLWMVHGGGFYLVEKQTKPKVMPRTLHWFKWEIGINIFKWIFSSHYCLLYGRTHAGTGFRNG